MADTSPLSWFFDRCRPSDRLDTGKKYVSFVLSCFFFFFFFTEEQVEYCSRDLGDYLLDILKKERRTTIFLRAIRHFQRNTKNFACKKKKASFILRKMFLESYISFPFDLRFKQNQS